MIGIKMIKQRNLTFLEKIYLIEIVKGMLVTVTHFFRNLIDITRVPTIRYPEEHLRLEGAARCRTQHRLKMRPDGKPKCVACFMCATACPAYCIYIEAGEYADDPIEKYPVKFNIDLSRCVFCGMCVEACPEDAIIMDTEIIPGGAYARETLMLTKGDLLKNLPGGEYSSRKGATQRLWIELLDKSGIKR